MVESVEPERVDRLAAAVAAAMFDSRRPALVSSEAQQPPELGSSVPVASDAVVSAAETVVVELFDALVAAVGVLDDFHAESSCQPRMCPGDWRNQNLFVWCLFQTRIEAPLYVAKIDESAHDDVGAHCDVPAVADAVVVHAADSGCFAPATNAEAE